MKVAAYQAPLLPAGSSDALNLIRERVRWCEAEGVAILCCPEAILGGLADYDSDPTRFAIDADRLASVLMPLASDAVTTIVGFSEFAEGRLYNSAAVFERGAVSGVYRKLHPAIRRSVYKGGSETPVFHAGGLTFGIVICNDSNFAEPARRMADQGATVVFVPTNNGLPPDRPGAAIASAARKADVARAVENGVWVVRADVAGGNGALGSCGSTEIVDREGTVVAAAGAGREDLIVAEIGK